MSRKMQNILPLIACLGASTVYATASDVIEPDHIEPNKTKTVGADKKDSPVSIDQAVFGTSLTSPIADQRLLTPDVQQPLSKKQAFNKKNNISLTTLETLAKHPQWHHLLFYKNGKAEVISADFYLTNPVPRAKRDFDPYAELIATIEQADNEQTLCKYPARYLWLNRHLPELASDLSRCPQLPDANQDISLILVSSYLKNPASSFGHVLVKTSAAAAGDNNRLEDSSVESASAEANSSDNARITALSSEDLLNSSYNFGARIPPDENGVMYAIKGLFGFYDSGFSETEFFKQDAVYAKNEQRDMWEYVLNLDAFETQLLNYHLYEAKSARFDYYFIKQNCGYRSGEILELVSDVKTTARIGAWYAPDYVFDQLLEHGDDSTSLVASVRYLPSEQTQLRQKFIQIAKPIQTVINTVIRTEDTAPLDDLNLDDKALALDFLILHRTYKISQDNTPEQQAFKNQLLAQRFMLPVSDGLARLTVPDKPSPALSNKTTQTKMILSDEGAEVGLSLFVKDPLNAYTDIDKRFEAVQASVGYDFDERQWTLTDFVFLDMQQIEDLTQPLSGEPKLSWQLKTGARTDRFTGANHSPYAQAGIGAGAKFGTHILGYGLVNAAVHDQDEHMDVGIELGLRAKRGYQGAELSYIVSKREGRASVSLATLTVRQQLSKNNDARIILTHTDNALNDSDNLNAAVAWHHYW